ncbi:MAG: hypothetical protein ABIG10_02760 [bacterium]
MNYRNTLMLRWSIITAGFTAIFWTIWFLSTGSVPVVTEIILIKGRLVYELPFHISRWWDILLGPIYSCAIVYLFTHKKIKDDDVLIVRLVFGLGLGLVAGLVIGLVAELDIGLAFGLVVGLIFGLTAGLGFGLGLGLVAGLVVGLVAGLALGLVTGLGAGLGFGLVTGLGALLKLIFRKRLTNWLLAKDKE